MTRTVFIDTETTSLDRKRRRIWDIAYIIRDAGKPDVEKQFFLNADLANADPISLNIGKYYERHPDPYGMVDTLESRAPWDVFPEVAKDLRNAYLVGAVPSFDEETLAREFRTHGMVSTWHYHLIDVETLAAGLLGIDPPWNFDNVTAKFGLKYDERERHTALGDARMARGLYDAVMGWKR